MPEMPVPPTVPEAGQPNGRVVARAERAAERVGIQQAEVERLPFDLSVLEDEGLFVNVDARGFGLLDRRLGWQALGISLPRNSDLAFRPPRCGLLPDRYRLGALIRLVTEELVEHRVVRLRGVSTISGGDVVLELRGRTVLVNDRLVTLGPNSLALLKTLARTAAVVSRQDLQRCLPEGADDHALEVAMSRLRQALAEPGLITTVVKRGYRLNAIPV